MNVSTQKTILRNFTKDLLTWQEMPHNFEATSKSIFQTIYIDEPPNNNLSNPSINLYKYLFIAISIQQVTHIFQKYNV